MILQAMLCPDGDHIGDTPITNLHVFVMLQIRYVNTIL